MLPQQTADQGIASGPVGDQHRHLVHSESPCNLPALKRAVLVYLAGHAPVCRERDEDRSSFLLKRGKARLTERLGLVHTGSAGRHGLGSGGGDEDHGSDRGERAAAGGIRTGPLPCPPPSHHTAAGSSISARNCAAMCLCSGALAEATEAGESAAMTDASQEKRRNMRPVYPSPLTTICP